MNKFGRPLGLALGFAALVASLALTGLWPQAAQAASSAKGQEPFTTTVSCDDRWGQQNQPPGTCVVNIDPVPIRKRFVVEYVSVLAHTDHASGQRLNVMLTFFSGPSGARKALRTNPVLVLQATTSNVPPGGIDTFHASEKVLAFAEGVDASGLPSGQLVVNRSTVPSDGFDTSVDVWISGYLEDVN